MRDATTLLPNGLHAARQSGFALPAVLLFMLTMASVTAIVASYSGHGLRQMKTHDDTASTYFVAEGATAKMIGEMSLYGPLWDQQATLAEKPSDYEQYSPAAYSSTNGIPTCTDGVSCHRSLYPVGGGLLKNAGPLLGAGSTVDSSYTVTEQIDFDAPPAPDTTLAGMGGWVQVERLDETTPSESTVGGGLSSAVAEGGNAKEVRFRLTGTAFKPLRGRIGASTVVAIVQLPVS
jgi:hypothetical protein